MSTAFLSNHHQYACLRLSGLDYSADLKLLLRVSEQGLHWLCPLLAESGSEFEHLLTDSATPWMGLKEATHWQRQLDAWLAGEEVAFKLCLEGQGTAFQRRVWQALIQIPSGSLANYSDVANAIAQPRAVRAVASACAANPIAFLIPCHRVVRKDGHLGGYRWGLGLKRSLLKNEGVS